MRLHGFAAAWGDRLFARLTTLEHEVAACVLAGDTDAEVARYLGVSRSKARRCLLRMVERLTAEAQRR
jgi:DNA-binding CsgD family transcriptional regulator